MDIKIFPVTKCPIPNGVVYYCDNECICGIEGGVGQGIFGKDYIERQDNILIIDKVKDKFIFKIEQVKNETSIQALKRVWN